MEVHTNVRIKLKVRKKYTLHLSDREMGVLSGILVHYKKEVLDRLPSGGTVEQEELINQLRTANRARGPEYNGIDVVEDED